jgi:hypothetical protein
MTRFDDRVTESLARDDRDARASDRDAHRFIRALVVGG